MQSVQVTFRLICYHRSGSLIKLNNSKYTTIKCLTGRTYITTTAKKDATVKTTPGPIITSSKVQVPKKSKKSDIYDPPKLGVLAAYDEALKYIKQDQEEKKRKIARLEDLISKEETNPSSDYSIQKLKKRKYRLQIDSEINDPKVRWNFRNGHYDMSVPVYCHLREREWRKKALPKLMERITQMYVIPDVFPTLDPTIDLRISFLSPIEPGTERQPELTLTSFHQDTRLYTLFMVDPDMPDVERKSFKTQWHWLITNIPLSATKHTISGGTTLLDYIPPHPPKGTPYHRYTIGVLHQPNDHELEIKQPHRWMNVREFMQEYRLELCGASFFRGEWDENVSIREPIYGPKPTPNLYLDETGRRPPKYLNL
ncbi:7571_t:CDS:2 [Ambispora leptoticha]|uniref:7571_t:CDS:1 n=1 Tax=Ambispora leptoticha TaxID=144679 RepID=A0A9N9AXH0_9GLOM|nr:7571_t:CDS:2 [Ambispora leptoticha]